MSSLEEISLYSGIWISVFAFTMILILRRQATVGLAATFLMTYLGNHWLGSVLYVVPWPTTYPPTVVAAGVKQATWGIIAFAVGVLLITPLVIGKLQRGKIIPVPLEQVQQELRKRIWTYLTIGTIFFFTPAIFPVLDGVPTINTLIHILPKFTVLGTCLFVYLKMRNHSPNTWLYVLLIATLFPLIGLVSKGFTSFGSIISILLLMFYFSYYGINVKKVMLLLIVAYIGLSGFAVYMRDRTEIRDKVWGTASLEARLAVIMKTGSTFEWFSLNNTAQLRNIDVRLNRNFYVGVAVYTLESGIVDYAKGKTFLDAFLAPIPRILWPDKPIISGDNTIMVKYTGITFARGNSAGTGPLFEAYVNFGTFGVIGLFLFYGTLLGVLDAQGRRALDQGHYLAFALWTLPIIELLNGVEPTSSIVAPAVFTYIVFKLWQRYFDTGPSAQTTKSTQLTNLMTYHAS